MPTKTKNLFACLSDFEAELSRFSYEELSSNEAAELKKTFTRFKNDLDKKFFDGLFGLNNDKDEEVTFQKSTSSNDIRLIANVSHEIRTPLNGIVGFTDLLKESNLTSTQKKHVDAIQSASHSLTHIINELLEYSKLSSGLSHFETIDFNFHKLINDVTYLCKTLIVDKDVELIVKRDSAIPKILVGDPSKLTQVLLNLIGNAIKFVDKGTIEVEINLVGLDSKEVVLEFDVTDTGIGMSENSLKHIFESFKQAEPDTYLKYGGTGLGLNIVKQIIESLNGEINVSSSLGEGSTFVFTLPYKKGNEENSIDKGIENTNDAAQVENMQILVFEDNTLNQRLIEQRLKAWNCNVFITDNITQGFDVLKNNEIDLILMDLKMPEMDGYEITEKIRSNQNTRIKQVPIIALTADFSVKDQKKCMEHGINDFILKPYNPEELLNKLIQNKSSQKIAVIKTSDSSNNTDNEHSKVNLDDIYKECMEEMEMLEELIILFKQNLQEFVDKVRLGIENVDYKAIKFAAHKVKAGLKMLKIFSLSNLVEEMHSMCETTHAIVEIENIFNTFLKKYLVVEEAIGNEVERLKKA